MMGTTALNSLLNGRGKTGTDYRMERRTEAALLSQESDKDNIGESTFSPTVLKISRGVEQRIVVPSQKRSTIVLANAHFATQMEYPNERAFCNALSTYLCSKVSNEAK
jgi:hypothetical protein